MLTFPALIGHRGIRGHFPENTLIGFRQAAAEGLTWVEFDVRLTADRVPVIMHDETVNRTTSGQGYVRSLLQADLIALDAGSWFEKKFHDEKVPTLQETLQLLNELGLSANVELKAEASEDFAATAEVVLKTVRTAWPAAASPLLFSSFSIPVLTQLRALDNTVLIGLLLDEWRDDWESIADTLQCVTLNINYRLLTESRVASIRNTQRQVLAYTVNDLSEAKKLWSIGVSSVFTDFPERLQVK